MKVAVITAPRDGVDYLPNTLRSIVDRSMGLVEPDSLAIFSDSPSKPTLPLGFSGAHVESSDQARLDRIRTERLFGTLNFIRALRWTARAAGLCMVFEDDVSLATDWYRRTAALALATQSITPRYIVSLHHFYQLDDFTHCRKVGSDILMEWKDIRGFYAGQGLVMPAQVAVDMADELERRIQLPFPERWQWLMDLGVKNSCLSLGIRLFATHPCLLQHEGDVSVACPGRPPIRNCHFQP